MKGESFIKTLSPIAFLKARMMAGRRLVQSFFFHIQKRYQEINMHRFTRDLHTHIHEYQTHLLHSLKEASGYRVVRVFRNYSAFSIVASSTLLVSASNLTQGNDANSPLFGYVSAESASIASSPRKYKAAQVSKGENLSSVPLANTSLTIDPNQKDEVSLLDMQGQLTSNQAILSTETSSISRDPEEEGGVKIYTVVEGDTVSGIASRNNITVNTILWANDLDNVDQIKPGDQIFILPVAGFSYAVKAGDTLDSIANNYKAEKDKIIAYNGLPANGEVSVGDVIIIPGGKKEISAPRTVNTGGTIERREYASSTGGTAKDVSSGFRTLDGKAGTGHRFPFGWCTWYVASKRYVPWSGNAGTWLYKAKALGYKTGRAPKVGAIMVTTENRYYGHVAFVEKVSGDTITVSEMNYVKWGKVDRRTLSASSRSIKGFIY
ncbi:MAG: hypothetical protein COZ27_01520 [Candidatus Moranbacteria bacterium CG_4_10_14_3_um_filter_41_65]|nr:MAG: hypothetical protein AUK58_02330 [Candidatus Moranbacteria bacterium CG2_30_41_165]PIP25471.1 MAG: hypothetical protein COX32_03185 [Candidatus Moranbacteria bacterium CG23_combo_of_CG06-09_8_20_14_all_41_28]PIV86052.1 MAG: hypothetical protein COW50_03675 [Candidatus Moranbacteria bacterium CG17_big_fil_post_rev_8_21_14_2_50_41_107]PIW94160.1 MAG: hypothetical protein COZ86_02600 [Candidatus Moranbacteria bacterium CG_4_8_14_3_um_filter_41_13]PIX91680.1 MAG: hypothetical protein COZ27_